MELPIGASPEAARGWEPRGMMHSTPSVVHRFAVWLILTITSLTLASCGVAQGFVGGLAGAIVDVVNHSMGVQPAPEVRNLQHSAVVVALRGTPDDWERFVESAAASVGHGSASSTRGVLERTYGTVREAASHRPADAGFDWRSVSVLDSGFGWRPYMVTSAVTHAGRPPNTIMLLERFHPNPENNFEAMEAHSTFLRIYEPGRSVDEWRLLAETELPFFSYGRPRAMPGVPGPMAVADLDGDGTSEIILHTWQEHGGLAQQHLNIVAIRDRQLRVLDNAELSPFYRTVGPSYPYLNFGLRGEEQLRDGLHSFLGGAELVRVGGRDVLSIYWRGFSSAAHTFEAARSGDALHHPFGFPLGGGRVEIAGDRIKVVPDGEDGQPWVGHVAPDPIIAHERRQAIQILGGGFLADSTVTLMWGSTRFDLPADRTTVVGPHRIDIVAGVFPADGTWQLFVTNPDDRRSNSIWLPVSPP